MRRRKRRHKATAEDLDLSGPVELIALSVKERAARCRLLGSDRAITLRASRLWDVVPGEIVTVKPRKQWSYAGHPYLSGEIEATRPRPFEFFATVRRSQSIRTAAQLLLEFSLPQTRPPFAYQCISPDATNSNTSRGSRLDMV